MFAKFINDPINRRLTPLYLSRFFGGVVLWYAIEKLYMTSIGFDATFIGISAGVLSIGVILFEVPLGVLADRWSRKSVMLLGEVSLILATIGLGLSESVVPYILCSLFYAYYISSNSGAVDAVVYDTLLEENGSRKGFEKYYGHVQLIQGIGLVLGGLVSAVVLNFDSVRSTYFWTLIPLGFSLVLLVLFKEPKLHKQGDVEKVMHQFKGTLKILFLQRYLLKIMVFMALSMTILEVMYEMDQLWPLALMMPLVWYGPLNSLLLFGGAVSGPLGAKIAGHKSWFLGVIALIIPGLLLLQVKNMIVIGLALFAGVTIYNALYIYGQGVIHDGVSSSRRTGASSIASMFSSLVIVPLIVAFGILVDNYSIFSAALWLLPVGVALVVVSLSFRHRSKHTVSIVENTA